ncbi:MAG: ribonuclease E/G [Sphingobium sp.]|nr:ribonuclease E/G [Sphingobium sp.]
MTMRMLIDARHREETRVAVVKGNRIEEFDFESAEHKQLKGNIYLAKVTRVEPSLQAAFVDYGGNRHGFLAFSEIHPDYYQIPREDREALLREEAQHAAEEAALRAEEDEALEAEEAEAGDVTEDEEHGEEAAPASEEGEEPAPEGKRRNRRGGGDSEADELRRKRMALRRRYKIQDVIHRRQVLLVQVVKEERGNKGAALTTYLSLAGRYCVLMPNTSHGGGISRKISNAADRKRLKSIISEMNLPNTMGCIVRTAGLQRTKPEIRRDFDYLARLWDEIREQTLKSAAPALIHNDSDLIKRAIRDIYNRDIEEVVVEGEEGYRAAKDFMKLLMPSHARRVKQYADAVSLFQRFGVEDQLAAMYHPVVQLKSGGYLVINPTEALVSIDINSGRSTREHGIEQTAVATNLEAAREIARQLRLRDMAGLVVIDFIDMEMNSNIRKVEKAMKEALKDDRARIQVGRISGFGLMEMSRQRLRTGVLEASTRECPHCEGTGLVRTASSAGLSALRLLEEEAARGRGSLITLRASQEAAFYVLNNKRRELDEIEMRYGVRIAILPDGETEGARMSVEASGPRPTQVVTYEPIVEPEDDDLPLEDELDEIEEAEAEAEAERGDEGDRDGSRKRRRRRRNRRGRRGEDREGAAAEGGEAVADAEAGDEEAGAAEDVAAEGEAPAEEGEAPRRSRRGRRGGRRRRGGAGGEAEAASEEGEASGEAEAADDAQADAPVADAPVEDVAPAAVEAPVEPTAEAEAEAKPKRRRTRKAAAKADEAPATEAAPEAPVAEAVAEDAVAEEPAKPTPKKRAPRRKKADVAAAEAAPAEEVVAVADANVGETAVIETPPAQEAVAEVAPAEAEGDAEDEASGEPRRGWWQRTFGS